MTPVCHYCGRRCTWSSSSSHIYDGRDFGPVWECVPCEARVGCHRTGPNPGRTALGTPAKKEDAQLRRRAHELFDPLWQRVAARDGISRSHARSRAYRWLAAELGKDPADTHIGMMFGDDLRRVIECCTPPFGLGASRGCHKDVAVPRTELPKPVLEG